MTPITIGILFLIIFLILMCLGVPIPFGMLFCGTLGVAAIRGADVAGQIVAADIYSTFSSYTLTVGPMFGLMGFIANYSNIGSSLFNCINKFMGHRKGGLAMATQVACAGFGAICGSVPATISTMSAIAYPEMRKRDYTPELAGGCIAAGAGLSVLIPPSTNFIIYGLATETSIGKLFVAGIFPGIFLCVANIIAIAIACKLHPDWSTTSPKASWKERWHSIVHGGLIEIFIVFIISMGGMFAGLFTATEAGAVGAFGMLIVTIVTRKLDFKKFMAAVKAGVRLQAMVFVLLACANVFGRMFTVSRIPSVLGNFVSGLDVPAWAIMLVIFIIYFFMGMVTDLLSMTLVTMPIFFPIVTDLLGYNAIWFGVIISNLICIGGITPPVGNGVFLVKGSVTDDEASLSRLFRGVWPFVFSTIIVTVVMLFFPQICTFLPTVIYGAA